MREEGARGQAARAVVFGGSGLLGRALVPALRDRGFEVAHPASREADVRDPDAVRAAVREALGQGPGPDPHPAPSRWVVNLAAFTDVDGAESDPDRAFAVNRDGAAHVARAAREAGARLLHLSTDYVFDGRASVPYPPDAPPSPLNVYGRTKLEGEEAVREAGGAWLVVRTSWLYGAGGRTFVEKVLERGRSGQAVEVVTDQRGRPTWTRSLARTLAVLMAREAEGTLHAADGGEASWWEVAREAFRLAGIPDEPAAVGSERFPAAAGRPAYSVLDLSETERIVGGPPPHWKESLSNYLNEGAVAGAREAPEQGRDEGPSRTEDVAG